MPKRLRCLDLKITLLLFFLALTKPTFVMKLAQRLCEKPALIKSLFPVSCNDSNKKYPEKIDKKLIKNCLPFVIKAQVSESSPLVNTLNS